MMDETDCPSSPDSTTGSQSFQQRTRNTRYPQNRDTRRGDEEKMPLVVPKMASPVLNKMLAPETQDMIVNWGVQFAMERPWMSSFLAIVALFAILPVLGLVLALIVLLGFVTFWLGVVLFLFACALAVTSLFAAGAWLYCLTIVLSTRWFLNLFSGSSSQSKATAGAAHSNPPSNVAQKDRKIPNRGPGGSSQNPALNKPNTNQSAPEKETSRTDHGKINGDSNASDSERSERTVDNDSWANEDDTTERDTRKLHGSVDGRNQTYAQSVKTGAHDRGNGPQDERERMRRDIEKSLK